MAEIKTRVTKQDPNEFLKTIEPAEKQRDGFELLKMFEEVTKEKAVMWGSSIVGFGMYHYKSERSAQEGDWMLVGFSPRKSNLTLYVMAGNKDNLELLDKLGKHKTSVGCLYINRLSEVNKEVLKKLIKSSFDYMQRVNK